MLKGKLKLFCGLVVIANFLFVFIFWVDVDKSLTPTDILTLQKIVRIHDLKFYSDLSSSESHLANLRETLLAIDKTLETKKAIDKGLSREPYHVVTAGGGQCFDRSRLIEKLIAYLGYQYSHVALYEIESAFHSVNFFQSLKRLFSPGGYSHSSTEVFIPEGSVYIDSYEPFVAEYQNNPVSLSAIQEMSVADRMILFPEDRLPKMFRKNFIFVRGLYSRHGMFYPPYILFPDIDFSAFELVY